MARLVLVMSGVRSIVGVHDGSCREAQFEYIGKLAHCIGKRKRMVTFDEDWFEGRLTGTYSDD